MMVASTSTGSFLSPVCRRSDCREINSFRSLGRQQIGEAFGVVIAGVRISSINLPNRSAREEPVRFSAFLLSSDDPAFAIEMENRHGVLHYQGTGMRGDVRAHGRYTA
jgi:hypothetical protein